MHRRLVLACVLVAVVLLTAGCAGGPFTGGEQTPTATTGQPGGTVDSTTSTPNQSNSTDDAPSVGDVVENHTADRFTVSALAESDDGGTLVAGAIGLRASNATVLRVGANDTTDWTREYASANRTGIAAIAPSGDGGAYVVRTDRRQPENASQWNVSVSLVRLGPDGERQWADSLNATGYVARGLALAQADDGVAVAYPHPDREVRLARYDDAGNVTLERAYGVEARPTALRTTDDGFVLAGTGSFDSPWVARANETGALVLNETYSDAAGGRVAGVKPTDDGDLLVAGTFQPGFIGTQFTPWVARVGPDGVPEWNRVYPTAGETRVRDVLNTDDGVVLVGSDRTEWADNTTTRFVGVAANGTEQFQANRTNTSRVLAAVGDGDGATAATMNYRGRNASTNVWSVELPDATAGTTLDAEAAPTSNESVYRGQALGFEYPNASADALDVVAVPGKHDDFQRHVERRVALEADGEAVVESATLPLGEYVLETPAGDALAVENGTLVPATGNETAAFEVTRHDLDAEMNSTYVDATTRDANATVSLSSQRSNFSVHVSVDRFHGDAAGADALRDAFADTPGFAGVERVDGRPVARVDLGSAHEATMDGRHARWNEQVAFSADALDAGLYRVRVAGADTRDGGATATTRLVVGKSTDEPLNVTLETDSLNVSVGNESATNVTVSGLDDGVGAMSMSARRGGQPAISLEADVNIHASRGEGHGMWSDREATASAAGFEGNTSEGTVAVGDLSVSADERMVDVEGNATQTVTFGLDWVVDGDGTPYAIPDERTITVEVTNETAPSQGS
ncbi:uncharacterized protein HHUB_2409 [Halobacterium hubeiense]|uniref:Uncharacterized protein n=4 Tax=Halobacterium hubeiense TaxID=1407499 RepID=A0A0U5H387_9EURY|nr:hypothetical protein [Halobacterium hubeiense]CQH56628.1 uncharacterized protein HHUB_2409 [Halobacterium hubeiense]